MTPEKMLSDLVQIGPMIFHFVISIFGIAMFIGGLIDVIKSKPTSHLLHLVEIDYGAMGVIVGLVLMYYGGAFPVIWSIIKWVS
jgi:hypothetical protein